MSRYELHGAPSGGVWHFGTEFGDGEPITDEMAIDMAQRLGWELFKIADDGTVLILWSPPIMRELSERAANAIVDLIVADAKLRGYKVPGGAS